MIARPGEAEHGDADAARRRLRALLALSCAALPLLGTRAAGAAPPALAPARSVERALAQLSAAPALAVEVGIRPLDARSPRAPYRVRLEIARPERVRAEIFAADGTRRLLRLDAGRGSLVRRDGERGLGVAGPLAPGRSPARAVEHAGVPRPLVELLFAAPGDATWSAVAPRRGCVGAESLRGRVRWQLWVRERDLAPCLLRVDAPTVARALRLDISFERFEAAPALAASRFDPDLETDDVTMRSVATFLPVAIPDVPTSAHASPAATLPLARVPVGTAAGEGSSAGIDRRALERSLRRARVARESTRLRSASAAERQRFLDREARSDATFDLQQRLDTAAGAGGESSSLERLRQRVLDRIERERSLQPRRTTGRPAHDPFGPGRD